MACKPAMCSASALASLRRHLLPLVCAARRDPHRRADLIRDFGGSRGVAWRRGKSRFRGRDDAGGWEAVEMNRIGGDSLIFSQGDKVIDWRLLACSMKGWLGNGAPCEKASTWKLRKGNDAKGDVGVEKGSMFGFSSWEVRVIYQ
uniref:Uncharacterized protein n=1 Tax=Oryza meridionalis TaxID=40149 RepID=A0A0E0DTG3_9ORYZ